ncbi:PREDICTED: uncharacterized protein LOC108576773 [Habropoda laboriosa]|uniref:uncharacterized protein LOC108576773 n=1 Tax=Habropoda laboriosa TaxID=597456 RepID=UPI00083D0EAE|nr:PREDICTED: uncharacterized protein LOC108576773 [Habropoda laboriosa]
MEIDSSDFSASRKKASRKRKEETSDAADSDAALITRRKKKQIVCSTEEERDESRKTDRLTCITELLSFCEQIAGDLNTADAKYLKKKAMQVYKICKTQQEENEVLKRKVNEKEHINSRFDQLDAKIGGAIAKILEIESNTGKSALSYAEKVKVRSNVVPQTAIKPPRNVITVYPSENSTIKDSEETKKAIVSSMTPAKEKLKIRNVRKINNKGILIETETPEDLQHLLRNQKLEAVGLKVGLPPRKKPRMIIYSIPTDKQDNEILKAIHDQNFENLTIAKFTEDFNLAFKTGDKSRTKVNWVVEVTPEIRETLKKSGKVFIDWSACNTQDFLAVSRCYKCQAFGHVSKFCTANEDTCGHCAQSGHIYKDCKSKSQNPTCANCKRANKPHNHCSRDKDCPAYENAIRTYINRIDYGK